MAEVGLAAKAGYWMLDYAYHVRFEALVLVTRPRPEQFLGGTLRPVLMLPGVFESWQFMVPLAAALHRLGYPVHVLPQLARNTAPIGETARTVADYIAANALTDVVLVGHSKGGLIGKYAMERYDRAAAIAGLVAVNSPFSGSAWAKYLRVPSVRMFSPRDTTVTFLGARSAVNERVTSIFGVFDQNIPEGSALVGARNVQVAVGGHSRIIGTRRLRAAVVEAVRDTPSRWLSATS